MTRKRFSEREVLETLYHSFIVIPCYRCQKRIFPGDAIEREHITEIALGGADTPVNCAYSHKLCHAIATNGTKATTAGSSKQRIAKVARLRGETKTRPKKQIQSRGFDKTRTRKFSGAVVPRVA